MKSGLSILVLAAFSAGMTPTNALAQQTDMSWWGRIMAAESGPFSGGDTASDQAPIFDSGAFPLEAVDLDGDGQVSRSELIGMLEGESVGFVDASTVDPYVDSSTVDPYVDSSTVDQLAGNGAEGAARDAGGGEQTAKGPQGARVESPFGVLSARREARFVKADTNGDGGVDMEELMQLRRDFMAAHGKEANDNRVRKQAQRIMGRIDTDGNGRISREELAQARGNRVMQALDADADGQISAAEWQVTLQ